MRSLVLVTTFLFAAVCSGIGATAKSEIEVLLSYVQRLEGAKFIRNGGEHSSSDAVAHLRLKWDRQAKRITTAEEFITLCASKSSLSGDRYKIKFKDGTVRNCDEVLREQLALLRQKPNAAPPPSR